MNEVKQAYRVTATPVAGEKTKISLQRGMQNIIRTLRRGHGGDEAREISHRPTSDMHTIEVIVKKGELPAQELQQTMEARLHNAQSVTVEEVPVATYTKKEEKRKEKKEEDRLNDGLRHQFSFLEHATNPLARVRQVYADWKARGERIAEQRSEIEALTEQYDALHKEHDQVAPTLNVSRALHQNAMLKAREERERANAVQERLDNLLTEYAQSPEEGLRFLETIEERERYKTKAEALQAENARLSHVAKYEPIIEQLRTNPRIARLRLQHLDLQPTYEALQAGDTQEARIPFHAREERGALTLSFAVSEEDPQVVVDAITTTLQRSSHWLKGEVSTPKYTPLLQYEITGEFSASNLLNNIAVSNKNSPIKLEGRMFRLAKNQ